MIGARSSAPPDPFTSPLRSRRAPDTLHSTPRTLRIGTDTHDEEINGIATTSATIDTDASKRATIDAERLRQTRSTSPLRSLHRTGAPNGVAATTRALDEVSNGTTALDEQEREHLRIQASPKSSAILSRPPSLPYDVDYPPLSPMGVDQVGYPLTSHIQLEEAKFATLNGAVRKGKDGRSGGPLAGRLANEKIRKTLPGQELERHMVSEFNGQHPMPWGLQSTLLGNQRKLARGRTRMGSLKRNASRDARTRVTNPIRSDPSLSEQSSPNLPTAEIQMEDGAADEGHALRVPIEENGTNSEGVTMDAEADSTRVLVDMNVEDGEGSTSSGIVALGERKEHLASNPTRSQPSSESIAVSTKQKGSGGRTSRRHEVEELGNVEGEQTQGQAADTSTESGPGSRRRPREAHKRLKLKGGYYGRVSLSNDESTSSVAIKKEGEDGEEMQVDQDKGEALEGHHPSVSRAASSTVEDSFLPGLLNDEIAENSSVPNTSTPVKATQHTSLSMGLRNSANKSHSGKMVHAGTGAVDNAEGNNEFCETCNGVGHFICCDGCPRSFHFACINPPLDIDELPNTVGDVEDKWYCNACKVDGKSNANSVLEPVKAKSKNRVFSPLLLYIDSVNPSTYSLPHEVRNYFKGVATATDGTYVDSTMLRPLKIGKHGLIDERDPYRLKEKNGKLVLCYRCGQSSLPPEKSKDDAQKRTPTHRKSPRTSAHLASKAQTSSHAQNDDHAHWRKIMGCDFCSLYWHFDCLDPPLVTMPSPSRKWMCPNHIEHAVRPERIPKSVANSTSIHDLPVPSSNSIGPGRHYRTRVVNDGQIDIIPDPMDTYFGSLSSSSSSSKEDPRSHTLALSVSGSIENRGKGLDKGWEEQDIPTSMFSSSNKSSNGHAISNTNIKFKYRLPEKVVRLDFWQRAEMERERHLARWINLVERRARSRFDALASVADAAIEAVSGTARTSANADAASNEDEAQLRPDEAKALVERIFGAQAVRPLFPALGVKEDDEEKEQNSTTNEEGTYESSVRQTYVRGEYEQEFDKRAAAANVSSLASTDMTSTSLTKTIETSSHILAGQLDTDVAEIERLRAIKTLLDRRGARETLAFLLA